MIESSATVWGLVGRLGNVLYWAACGLAAVLLVLASLDLLLSAFPGLADLTRGRPVPLADDPYYGLFSEPAVEHGPAWPRIAEGVLLLVGAGGVWLAGRAARYVLGGR
jgi:hypothetical protein